MDTQLPGSVCDPLRAMLGPKGFTEAEADLAPWLRDWRGAVEGRAVAMVSPATVDEVEAVVRFAAAHRIALVPQGGNSSMVAGSTPSADGAALLVSLRRLNRIRSASAEDAAIVAEAGVILHHVHEAAAAIGLRFPLSLGAKGSATIGGLVSTNAGGTQVLRFGTMRQLLLGIEAVMPDGARFDGLAPLRKDNRGYDLRQLLAGAEGTLGIVTAATLRLVPAAGQRAVAWAGLASPHAALALLRRIERAMGDEVESFELVPNEALTLVLGHVPGTRVPLAGAHAWHVLVEATAPVAAAPVGEALEAGLAGAIEAGIVEDATVAASEAQGDALWRLREAVPEAERAAGPAAKHDVSVPVSQMPDFIVEARALVERHFAGVRVVAFGHLGDGNVHFNVWPPAGVDAAAWLTAHGTAVNALVYDDIATRGGSLSAEHGIGQTKLEEFERLAGATRLATMRAIKAAIDPLGIMNPGKLVRLAPARTDQ